MKPAFSVIFFTVSSGAGLGLLIWLVMARLFHSSAPSDAWWFAFFAGVALLSAGLLSSTQHLANPKNAWRAFTRFATSWLSREGVFSVLLYPLLMVYAVAVIYEWGGMGRLVGSLVILLALVVLLCTAMIYACLKTIPRWHNWQTMASYPLFGLMSGALLLMALMPGAGAVALRWIAVVSLLAAAAVKLSYQIRFDKPAGITLGDAIKQSWGKPRLLDVGHTHASFLTREFGYELAASQAILLKLMMWLLAFAIPLLIVVFAPGLAWLAALCCIVGLTIERWLFFAQARHVVRLYHGAQQV